MKMDKREEILSDMAQAIQLLTRAFTKMHEEAAQEQEVSARILRLVRCDSLEEGGEAGHDSLPLGGSSSEEGR